MADLDLSDWEKLFWRFQAKALLDDHSYHTEIPQDVQKAFILTHPPQPPRRDLHRPKPQRVAVFPALRSDARTKLDDFFNILLGAGHERYLH